MTGGVVVYTIGEAPRARGPRVSELRRRLAERGVRISRGTLDRLASDQPVKQINVTLLLPVLDEVGMSISDSLRVVDPVDLTERRARLSGAQREARTVAQRVRTGRASHQVGTGGPRDHKQRRGARRF